ncbi:MAG: peptide deformylase [Oscillospiraceae bacterium]|nr:peptide deformylase [Oscillospiraceae bacterium]
MALRTILNNDEGALSKRSREVVNFDTRLHILLDDMRETLNSAGGVGLAAPQVGVLRRAAIIELTEGELIEIINPELISAEGSQNASEGCLSFPGIYGMVERAVNVEVKAFDRYGKEIKIIGNELLARALCHEIDHLNGVVFTEHVTEYVDREEAEADRKRQGYRR